MKRSNTSIPSEQQHLSLAVLRRYTEGTLPASQEHRVEKHVLHCELCADILAGMEAQPARQTAAAVQEINRRLAAARQRQAGRVMPLFSRQRMAMAASLLLLLCAAGVVLFYHTEQVKQQGRAPVAASSSEPAARELPVLRPSQPATANPPVAAESQSAPAAATPPATIKRKEQGAAVAQRGSLPGPEPGSGPAGAAVAEVVVDVPPAGAPGPEAKPDSAAVGTRAVAAAPAPAPAAPAGVLSGRVAGVSVERQGRMARSRVADAAAGKTISGQVLDEAGQPLPGVTVLLKGSSRGTVTDPQGRYNLPLPQGLEEATLAYNFIGYAPLEKTMQAGAPAAGDVTLQADTRSLSEVVVVGYEKETAAGITAPASPLGGWNNFKKHLQANLQHPLEQGRKVSGRVVVGFTVNPDGRLTDVRVLKSLSAATDAEALRLVQQGPGWQAAKAGDKAVAQPMRVTIRFRGKE